MTKSLLTVAAMALSIQAINAAEAVVAEIDFSKTESYDMYHSDHVTPVIQDGALYINNTTADLNFWDVQYFVLDGFDLEDGVDEEIWVDKRRAEVIDAPYFHVVFTLPHELNPLVYCNQ